MTWCINHCWRRRMAKSARYANLFAPWSVALFCECDKATLLQWHEEKRAYNQAGNTMQSTALKTLHVIFCCSCVNTLKCSSSEHLLWEVRLNPMPARLRSMTSSLSEAANGSAAHRASRGLSEVLPRSGFSSLSLVRFRHRSESETQHTRERLESGILRRFSAGFHHCIASIWYESHVPVFKWEQ